MRFTNLTVAVCLLSTSTVLSQSQQKTIPEQVAETGKAEIAVIWESPSVHLGSLIDASPLIIRGRVTSTHAELAANNKEILTIADVQITDVLSNALGQPIGSSVNVGSVIALQFNGGRLQFPNGVAELKDYDYERLPAIGDDYIAFLSVSRANSNRFELARSTQGLFRILTGKIVPDMPQSRPLYQTWKDRDSLQFQATLLDNLKRKGR